MFEFNPVLTFLPKRSIIIGWSIDQKLSVTKERTLKTFIDSLATMDQIKPEDVFRGFYERFEMINKLSYDELIVSMQALNLALSLGDPLDDEHEEILMHIVTAMQTRAFKIRYSRGSSWEVLNELFFMGGNGTYAFHYDSDSKKLKLEKKPVEKPADEQAEKVEPRKDKGLFARIFG